MLPQDTLVYSLVAKPDGMTIDPATGSIEWRPTSAQAGTYDVQVKVADSNSVPVTDTQSFTITVTSLKSPLKETLTVVDCFGLENNKRVSLKDKVRIVRTSDDNRLEMGPRSDTYFDFSDASIPNGATVKSVVIYLEHYEDIGFPSGKLEWLIGTSLSTEPDIWTSFDAPIRQGRAAEATDAWDVTSAVETPEKANSLQLQIRNNGTSGRRKTSVNLIYAVVEWY